VRTNWARAIPYLKKKGGCAVVGCYTVTQTAKSHRDLRGVLLAHFFFKDFFISVAQTCLDDALESMILTSLYSVGKKLMKRRPETKAN
jgi:hypothetical protein